MSRTIVGASCLALVALVFVAAPMQSAIVLQLPHPTGAWAVGTTVLTLDLHDATAIKSTLAQVWYPTSLQNGPSAPYAYRVVMGLRDRLVSKFVRTSARLDAAVATGKWPLIVYLPGLGANRVKNTALCQELASQGYFVVAMDDTRPFGGFDFSTKELTQASIRWGDRAVSLRANDVSLAIDALDRVNRDRTSRFAGKIDFPHVGVVGFSFGGAVAAEAAGTDPRIRAAANLDGWMFGSALRDGVDGPYLIMSSDPYVDYGGTAIPALATIEDEQSFDRRDTAMMVAGLHRRGGYFISIADFKHKDFTDATFIPSIGLPGRRQIEPRRGYRIVSEYVREFFDCSLKHRQPRLLDGHGTRDDAVSVMRFEPHTVRPGRRSANTCDAVWASDTKR